MRALAPLVLLTLLLAPLSRAQPPCNSQWQYGPGQGLPGLNGTVRALITWDPDGPGTVPDLLIVGGRFTIAGHTRASNIAAWDGATWQPFGGGTNEFGDVFALTVFNGDLIAAGGFTTIGGQSIANIARWNGSMWQPLGAGISAPVRALTVYNGELIAAGNFHTAGGASVNNIARWNGSAWQPLGSGLGFDFGSDTVYATAVYNGELIACGDFTVAGGASASRVARWNGSTWQPLGAGVGFGVGTATAYSLAVYNNELIVGGAFNLAGGAPANSIARWDGSAWLPLGSGLTLFGSYGTTYALAVRGTDLLAAGRFSAAGGNTAQDFARWNGSAWDAPANISYSGIGPEAVYALSLFRDDLIIAGNLSQILFGGGGINAAWIARWP
jgi:hypothetical protein